MPLVHRYPELTSGPVAEFSADFHLGRQSDDRDPDFVSDAGLEGFVDVTGVTGRERTKDDKDLSRGVCGEVAVCSGQCLPVYNRCGWPASSCSSPFRSRFGD